MGRYLQLADQAILRLRGVEHAGEPYDKNDKNDQSLCSSPSDYMLSGRSIAPLRCAAPQSTSDDFEERAAICEYMGGIPRDWAEGLARLCTMPAPADVPERRWRTFLDDCARFADCWVERASALGWGPHDLWGCDGLRPLARLDKQGLLWLLNGRDLVALTANSATIRTVSGGTLTYRRSSSRLEMAILAWELEP